MLVMYVVSMILNIIARVNAEKWYAIDVEKCRRRFKTTGIVSVILNAIPFVTMFFSFIISLFTSIIEMQFVAAYVELLALFAIVAMMGAALAFSIMELIYSSKNNWYSYREV